jgi:hypothetical protein
MFAILSGKVHAISGVHKTNIDGTNLPDCTQSGSDLLVTSFHKTILVRTDRYRES